MIALVTEVTDFKLELAPNVVAIAMTTFTNGANGSNHDTNARNSLKQPYTVKPWQLSMHKDKTMVKHGTT